MRKINCLIFLFLSLNVFLANAQVFEPGYIITFNNDTLSGWIGLQSEALNSKRCVFKSSEQGDEEVFTPEQISGYRFAETGRFFNVQKLAIEQKPVSVFMEFILKGKVSLYYYQAQGVDNYFLKSPDGVFYEIKSYDVVKQSGNFVYDYVKDERYIDVLNEVFKDKPEMKTEIMRTDLNRESLIRLTTKYNNLSAVNGEKSIVYQKKKMPFHTSFILKGGMTYLFSALKNQDIYVDKSVFSVSEMWSPLFGLQCDFFMADQSPAFRLCGAASIAKLQSENYTSTYDLSGDIYLYKVFYNAVHYNFYLGAKYIYPAKYFRPYVGMGGLCTLLSKPNIGLQKESRGSAKGVIKTYPKFFAQMPNAFGVYGDIGFEISLLKGLSLVYGAQAEYTKYGVGLNSTFGIKF